MILDKMSLEGKVGVVTGGSRGIGRGAAMALAEAGADIVLNSRNTDRLESTADQIRSLGRKVVAVPGDMGVKEDIERLIETTLDQFGKIDILVNNAGTTYRIAAEDFPEDEWDRVLDVNLKGVFLCCQLAGREMIKRKKGKIINTASLTSTIGIRTTLAYGSSKGGQVILTKTLAVEWAKYNINVNAIAPGFIATDLTKPIREDRKRNEYIMSRVPMERWGSPEDLKGAFVFLASEASDFITGQIIYVDGGWTAG